MPDQEASQPEHAVIAVPGRAGWIGKAQPLMQKQRQPPPLVENAQAKQPGPQPAGHPQNPKGRPSGNHRSMQNHIERLTQPTQFDQNFIYRN
jgi:hypothetical protein